MLHETNHSQRGNRTQNVSPAYPPALTAVIAELSASAKSIHRHRCEAQSCNITKVDRTLQLLLRALAHHMNRKLEDGDHSPRHEHERAAGLAAVAGALHALLNDRTAHRC